MKKHFFSTALIIGSLTFFVSCKTLQVTDLQPKSSHTSQKLPSLEAQIDLPSLENAYSKGVTQSTGVGLAVSTSSFSAIGVGASTSISYSDKRIQDVITLFQRDVINNISQDNSEVITGKIGLRITFSNIKFGGGGYIIPAIFTAGLAWAFGMPINVITQELELEVSVMDKNNKLIKKYTGYGKAKVNVAAYSGYKKMDGPTYQQASVGRKANIEAYNMAMAEIKASIEKDYDRLQKALQTN